MKRRFGIGGNLRNTLSDSGDPLSCLIECWQRHQETMDIAVHKQCWSVGKRCKVDDQNLVRGLTYIQVIKSVSKVESQENCFSNMYFWKIYCCAVRPICLLKTGGTCSLPQAWRGVVSRFWNLSSLANLKSKDALTSCTCMNRWERVLVVLDVLHSKNSSGRKMGYNVSVFRR